MYICSVGCNIFNYSIGNQIFNKPCGKDINKGREQIRMRLKSAPPTKHDFGSFFIDVPLANVSTYLTNISVLFTLSCVILLIQYVYHNQKEFMIQISVTGVFVDRYNIKSRTQTFRSFCRVFCILPLESGWSILNDMLFVSPAPYDVILVSELFNFSSCS